MATDQTRYGVSLKPWIVLWFCEDGNGWQDFETHRDAEAWAQDKTIHDCWIVHSDDVRFVQK
jgi:hypothetical protein